ncbi:MAG: hypothetical protein D6773_07685, partial [Alphaproteobacteria bacterium]
FRDFQENQRKKDGTALCAADGKPLTHAAGLVFCNTTAPITRIKDLAMELADFCKARVSRDGQNIGRRRDSAAVLALESFDHLGCSVEAYLEQRFPARPEPGHFVLEPEQWQALRCFARILRKKEFPRRQLRRLAAAVHDSGQSGVQDVLRTIWREFDWFDEAWEETASTIEQNAAFVLLEELWDYFTLCDWEEPGTESAAAVASGADAEAMA